MPFPYAFLSMVNMIRFYEKVKKKGRKIMSKKKKEHASDTAPKRTYKFKDVEVWNADNTMAEFNYQLLKKFKKMKRYGYPGDLCPEADTPEKWEKLIKSFIKTFKRITNDFDDSPMSKALDKLYAEHPKYLKMKMLKQEDGSYIESPEQEKLYNKYVTQKVIEKEKIYYQKIDENLQLFGKYFLHFWD